MLPDGYRIDNDSVEWGGLDSAILSAAILSWAGVLWAGYRTWRLIRRGG